MERDVEVKKGGGGITIVILGITVARIIPTKARKGIQPPRARADRL